MLTSFAPPYMTVQALEKITAKLQIKHWDISRSFCSGGVLNVVTIPDKILSNVNCSCNNTVCHVTNMYDLSFLSSNFFYSPHRHINGMQVKEEIIKFVYETHQRRCGTSMDYVYLLSTIKIYEVHFKNMKNPNTKRGYKCKK